MHAITETYQGWHCDVRFCHAQSFSARVCKNFTIFTSAVINPHSASTPPAGLSLLYSTVIRV